MSSAARANVELVMAWLDAHNRQDMKALDYMSDDVEIAETPTGVVWRGRKDMENLARLAYSRKSHKKLTHVFATDTEACVEYVATVSTADPVSGFEKEQGLHGLEVSGARPTAATLELPVCFVCEIEDGKIRRAREYWDAAGMARQLGIAEEGQREATPAPEGLTPKVILEQKVAQNIRDHPKIKDKVRGICQFDITGADGGQWYLDLSRPDSVVPGTSAAAACTLVMRDEDFVAYVSGQLSAQRAFVTGKLKIKGDMGMASALREVLQP